MRFTTCSTLTNAFIFSAVALLPLVPTANAWEYTLAFSSPGPGSATAHSQSKYEVSWYVSGYEPDLKKIRGDLILKNHNEYFEPHNLGEVGAMDGFAEVVFPEAMLMGGYYIQFYVGHDNTHFDSQSFQMFEA